MHERGTAWHDVLGFTLLLGLALGAGCARDVTPRDEPADKGTGDDGQESTDDVSMRDDSSSSDQSTGSDEQVFHDNPGDSDGDEGSDGTGDDGDDTEGDAGCAAAQKTFEEFVASHLSCEGDEDCAIIGDCGPHAEFVAVRADVAGEAYTLMEATCSGAFDGPVYDPVCVEGTCQREQRTDTCCGCPPGWDGGTL